MVSFYMYGIMRMPRHNTMKQNEVAFMSDQSPLEREHILIGKSAAITGVNTAACRSHHRSRGHPRLGEKFSTTDLLLGELGIRTEGVDMSLYSGLARYAIEGDCSYFLTPTGTSVSLLDQCTRVIGIQELFDAFEEFTSGPGASVAAMMMLNMLSPRSVLDIGPLGFPDGDWISLIELALLAGLKEETVRNYAVPGSKYAIATHRSAAGIVVKPEDAHSWLVGRKKYRETVLPTDPEERDALLRHVKSFDLSL